MVHTPGRTPESVSFLIEEQSQPTAIFTGGRLMLGGAACVDLLGSKIAPFLAGCLHNTIHGKLLKLPDDLLVYPTHGGGSFCSAAAHRGGEIPTIIARERLTNPFAAEAEETSFCSTRSPAWAHTSATMSTWPTSTVGARISWAVSPGWLPLVPLSVRSHLDNEAILIDSRPKRSFNDEHLPGCLMATPWLPGSAGW